jgi:hypothetical protein
MHSLMCPPLITGVWGPGENTLENFLKFSVQTPAISSTSGYSNACGAQCHSMGSAVRSGVESATLEACNVASNTGSQLTGVFDQFVCKNSIMATSLNQHC